jgi:hypothetical protein
MISIITSLDFLEGAVFEDIKYRKKEYFVKLAREIREETEDF